jgi:Protein of unknown function (DUF3800)
MTPVTKEFVHLAYLDDSDTKAKPHKWQVMSGVVIEDKKFKIVEIAMCFIRELLGPSEKLDKFEEFHACELYGGHGVFEGIEQEKRFETIKGLLNLVKSAQLPIVYGAVDLSELGKADCASADPVDISFRICVKGIKAWAQEYLFTALAVDPITQTPTEEQAARTIDSWVAALVILIADECDAKIRNTIQKSFRSIRPPHRSPAQLMPPIIPFHDDMYFGDSRYSVGIQLADLCSYFIARHLDGDKEIEPFYEMIASQIVFSKIYPEQPLVQAEIDALQALYAKKEITDGK